MDKIKNDSRFAHIAKDVRFKKMSRREKKVKIDKRFESMFTDDRFKLKSVVDKRGRPQVAKGIEHLERFYDLSDSEDSENEQNEEENLQIQSKSHDSTSDSENDEEKPKSNKKSLQSKVKKNSKLKAPPENENSENEENLEEPDPILPTKPNKGLSDDIKAKLKDLTVDYARGEGVIESDSSSDEESSSSEEEEHEVDHEWGERDREAGVTEVATPRLALCDMDWDRITAQDIMVLINSFVPAKGLLKSVTIYPSEFGLKRLQEEEEKGPSELTTTPVSEDKDEDTLNIEQREKLRKYQLNRLKYFYAVLVFDSAETADRVYKDCDGLEYESSMNRLDLRFVPDDTEFDQTPREECTSLPDLHTYKPRLYRTTALTQVKVDLTWDETDPSRQELIRAAHNGKLDESKLQHFLASSSEDEEEQETDLKTVDVDEGSAEPVSEKKAIEKYKALLAGLTTAEEKDEDVAMEVTWDTKVEKNITDKVKESAKSAEIKTPFEKYLEKRKDKKKLKKSTKKSEETASESEGETPFSDDDLPSDIDMNDPYFKEELDNSAGKTKKKNKKNQKVHQDEDDAEKQKKAELELLMLDETDEGPKQHFSLKKIEESEKKSKKKKRKFNKKKTEPVQVQDDFKMDVKDERFSAIFSSHLYNVDPAATNFKATEGMKAIIAEKVKRKTNQPDASEQPQIIPEKKRKDAELNLLVKSVQRKTQAVNLKRKKKK